MRCPVLLSVLVASLAAASLGCVRELPRPDEPGASDAYRHELDVRPHSPRAFQARQQLEVAEYDAAKSAHTVLAYRRFLEEFPEGSHATDVRKRLGELRWAAADRDGSELALRGFLADEGQSAHAAEAWSRLSQLRLDAALRDGTAPVLRDWLQENQTAAGRERALAALDEADFRAANGPEGMRAYLADHEGGAHRAAAAAAVERASVEEAALLEDEAQLQTLAKSGIGGAAQAASEVAYRRAAALLDEGRLGLLSRRGDARAAHDLATLRKDPRAAQALEPLAQRLFLPRATLDELPGGPLERAAALRGWAASIDGARLQRMLAEMASPRAWVSLTALEAVQSLLAALPSAESHLRAARALASVKPVAQDAPQLAQVALLERALGNTDAALADARSAVARDARSLVASFIAATLEAEAGEPAVRLLAAQGLAARARELAEAHGQGAPEPLALRELCASRRAAERAASIAPALREEAEALRRKLEEKERALGGAFPGCDQEAADAQTELERTVKDRLAAAAALGRSSSPLARAALERARARDPDAAVRAAAAQTAQARPPRQAQ